MENNLTRSNDRLKLFVILIGILIWFPVAYFSYVFANWQTHFFIESNIFVKCIILLSIFIVWLSGVHKIIYAMFFVTLNHKYGDILYCLAGVVATILAYFLYLNNHPIFLDSSNIKALLSVSNENSISKALSLSSYISLMIIFICNYCLFPVFNRKK